METICYAGSNWFIKKENTLNLTITKEIKGFNKPVVIQVALDDPLLSLPLPERSNKETISRIMGEPFYKEFNMEAIEKLSESSNHKKEELSILN